MGNATAKPIRKERGIPINYRGEILVTDIDHTLRRTTFRTFLPFARQIRIPGARRLVARVAARGAPVVYLTAAPARLFRRVNKRFLRRFPRGTLVDRPGLGLADLNPIGQAHAQAKFKVKILRRIRRRFPVARIVCLGDDRFGDAIAYSGRCHASFVRRAVQSSKNVPREFSGERFRRYNDPGFEEHVLAHIGPERLPPGRLMHLPGVDSAPVGRVPWVEQ